MKKAIKWFLGIFAGIVVVAVLVGGAFLVFNRRYYGGFMMNDRNYQDRSYGRGMPWQNNPGQKTPLNPGPRYEMPMHPFWGARLGGFGPLRLVFLCLIGIGFFMLIVMGIIYLFKPRLPAAIVSPAVVPLTAQPAPAPVHPCLHCRRPVQDDWSHCPYCGGSLK